MLKNITSEKLIDLYQMQRHPEGGYYVETYKSINSIPESALPKGLEGSRLYSSAIYFLLCNNEKSKLHKIAFDEVWHFYLGEPMIVVEILPDGQTLETTLGPDVQKGQKLRHVVPGGRWFGAYLPNNSKFSFVGCTVAPGFDFRDFKLGDRDSLLKLYPQAKKLIEHLT